MGNRYWGTKDPQPLFRAEFNVVVLGRLQPDGSKVAYTKM